MGVLHVLLVVWVNPSCLLVCGLSSLQKFVLHLDVMVVVLHFTVVDNLLATEMLLLDGVLPLLLGGLLLHHLLLF